MNSKNLTMKKILIVFSVLFGIVLVSLHGTYAIVSEMERQLMQNLEDVAAQNAAILESKIDAQHKLILSLSKELEGVTEDTIQEKLDSFESFLADFRLKRFAYCFPGGMTYSTDQGIADLSYRSFYQKGMEGKSCITGILSDALKKEHSPVNVMTIPVYDASGAVSGVFGLAYDAAALNETLQIKSFDGKGYSCVLNEEGEIVSAMGGENLIHSGHIIEQLLALDEKNVDALNQLQALMQEKEEGSGKLYVPETLYYYVVPVHLMEDSVTWYMLTLVPSEVLNQRLFPIQKTQYVTCLLIVFLVVIGAVLFVLHIKEQHEEILRYAYEDPVTGGPNYMKFQLEIAQRSSHEGCLIVMDIANFNNIAVVAGEAASDVMVRESWEIIQSSLEKEELAAHIRDDMFLLFLLTEEKDKILQRMQCISEKIGEKAKNFEVYGIQARYGICWMQEKEPLESAYSKVKLAREYAVLSLGVNYAFYSEVNRVKMQHEKQLEDRFPMAIATEEFEIWYQPKYSAGECQIVGSEALVRWRNEKGEMISPGEFIPLFENNGMIVKLDEYMFRAVCRQQKKWLDEGKRVYPVSVNISRASLYCFDVHKRYHSIMQEYQLDPSYIQLEVTETVMEERSNICDLLNKFRHMGIKILMDDFGTGYSSLATLSLQCFDTLKLDKTLIDHIGNKDGETMLYHIIRMGQQMGLHITAEGVEKQTQLSFLQDMQCDDIQGFYFSKPVTRGEYEEMINRN